MRRPLIPSLLAAIALLAAAPAGAQTQSAPADAAGGGQRAGRPLVYHTQSAKRGEVVSGRVSVDGTLQTLEVTLQGPGDSPRVVAVTRGFHVDELTAGAAGQGGQWVFLLGLESTLQPGPYLLQVCGSSDDGVFQYEAEITVGHREFRSQSIAFDASLSGLMTTPDPRRDREAAELLEALSAFHGAAAFHAETLELPVRDQRRTSLYGDRRLYQYVDGGSSRSLHNGADLASPEGAEVLAAGSGRVVLARSRLMTGNSVVLEHLPGVFTVYYHLRDLEVQEGDLVAQGARIGTVGQTGLATGPHLHWELRVSGVAVDPEIYLARPLIDKFPDSGTLIP